MRMDDLTKIILTSSLTVIGGVFVYVVGQLLGKFIIEPVQALKALLGEIQYSLVFHAQPILTPVGDREREDEAQKTLRKLSCDLRSKVGAIPFYGVWSAISFGFLPPRENVYKASIQLMGLSNSVHKSDRSERNGDRMSSIEKLLNYEPFEH